MSLASSFREIAAILLREAAGLDGAPAPATPATPVTPAPSDPAPIAPPPPSTFPAAITAGQVVPAFLAYFQEARAALTVPPGLSGSWEVSIVSDGVECSLEILNAAGSAIIAIPARPSAASMRIYGDVAPWWAERMKIAPGTYTLVARLSQPSKAWVQFT